MTPFSSFRCSLPKANDHLENFPPLFFEVGGGGSVNSFGSKINSTTLHSTLKCSAKRFVLVTLEVQERLRDLFVFITNLIDKGSSPKKPGNKM